MRKRHTRAFTLIELLVVIAIIALLLAIIIPALAKAKRLAWQVIYSQSQKAYARAAVLYAENNKDDVLLPVCGTNILLLYCVSETAQVIKCETRCVLKLGYSGGCRPCRKDPNKAPRDRGPDPLYWLTMCPFVASRGGKRKGHREGEDPLLEFIDNTKAGLEYKRKDIGKPGVYQLSNEIQDLLDKLLDDRQSFYREIKQTMRSVIEKQVELFEKY